MLAFVESREVKIGGRAVESEVREAYEQLVAAFREGRWDDKFASFAEEATVVDGGRWFGSLSEYRAAWNRWAAEQDALPVPLSVDTRIMKLQVLGQAAVLTHSIDSRERTDTGEETAREVETIVFGKQHDGRWLIVHQHLSPRRA
jgi:ketosteroid isomerase-like protein